MTDLERAYSAITGKSTSYTALFNYYDGNQPLMYASNRLKDIFANLDVTFVENWCAVVIDAVLNRITLQGFDAGTAQEQFDTLLYQSELLLEAKSAHEAAEITGEAYLIAWPDVDGNPQLYYNDPRLCQAFYDAENPRLMTFAAKMWTADDGTLRLTLYYPDRLEYYATSKPADQVSAASAFQPMDPPSEVNPYNQIPVFRLVTSRRRVKSELTNAIPIQAGINKLLTDMMVAAEYGAFGQRWIISNVETKGKLKNAPNENWDLPAGDGQGQGTQVGQFQSTDLGNYLGAIENLAKSLAAITKTPDHYFFGSGSAPSGESLIVREAPLNKKAADHIEMFVPVWQQVAAFLLRLAGVEIDPRQITPRFADPETVQPRTAAEITQIRTQSGVPLTTALRWEGRTAAEIEQMQEDKAAEQRKTNAGLGTVIMQAIRQEVQASEQGQERQGQERQQERQMQDEMMVGANAPD